MPSTRALKVGLISDTHGLLRTEAVRALRASDFIVHAGDIGSPAVLDELSRMAPVTAVRGNNDVGAWASALPDTDVLRVGEASVFVIHNLAEIGLDPAAAGFRVVVSGHSHRPSHRMEGGMLFVNPGSAGRAASNCPLPLARSLWQEPTSHPSCLS